MKTGRANVQKMEGKRVEEDLNCIKRSRKNGRRIGKKSNR